jgi:hypothetical protein
VGYRTHGENTMSKLAQVEREALKLYDKHIGKNQNGPATDSAYQREVAGYFSFNAALAHLRARDLPAGIDKLKEAVKLRPALLEADEFYYELACAFQPTGYRGSPVGLRLVESEALLYDLIFRHLSFPSQGQRAQHWGRACLILAQVAYTTGLRRASARYAWQSIWQASGPQKSAALRMLARAAVPQPMAQWLRARRGTPAQVQRQGQLTRPT